jgi:hypothetical protein
MKDFLFNLICFFIVVGSIIQAYVCLPFISITVLTIIVMFIHNNKVDEKGNDGSSKTSS